MQKVNIIVGQFPQELRAMKHETQTSPLFWSCGCGYHAVDTVKRAPAQILWKSSLASRSFQYLQCCSWPHQSTESTFKGWDIIASLLLMHYYQSTTLTSMLRMEVCTVLWETICYSVLNKLSCMWIYSVKHLSTDPGQPTCVQILLQPSTHTWLFN